MSLILPVTRLRRSVSMLLLSLLCLAAPALAQGTSGSFPDPISTREMERYAQKLNMSDQQRQGIGLYHDQYLEAFRDLRDGPIEDFLKEYGNGGGMRFNAQADPKVIQKETRKRADLLKRIRILDNRYFDEVQSVLTDDQTALLPRVRQARDRVRYRSGLSRTAGLMRPGSRIDLSELVDELKLLPQDREIADAIISQYERTLTSEIKELHERSSSLQLDMQEKLAAAGGWGGGISGNREDRQAFMQTLSQVFSDMNQALIELASEVTDLNKRTLKQVTSVLPPEHARQLKDRYNKRAYPNIPTGRGSAGRRFDAAKKIKDLTEDQHQQIDTLEVSFLSDMDRLIVQMIDQSEKMQADTPFMRFGRGERDDSRARDEDKLESLRERRTTIIERSIASLNTILGQEFSNQLDRRVAAGEEPEEEQVTMIQGVFVTAIGGGGGGGEFQSMTITSVGGMNFGAAEEEEEETGDEYLPGPISHRELERYSKFLGIESDQSAILETLHDDYLDQFREIQDTQIKAVREKSRSQWSINPESNEMTGPSRGDIKNLYQLRRRALKSIQALDESFFADIETVLVDESKSVAMQRVRFARKRTIYSRGRDTGGFRMFGGSGRRGGRGGGGRVMSFTMGGSNSSESVVDLSSLVADLELPEQERSAIDTMLYEYETTVTNEFESAFETSLRFNEAMDTVRAESMTQSADGSRREMRINGNSMRNILSDDGRQSSEIQQAITELNRQTLEKLTNSLPEDAANSLRDAYHRKAFPEIFDDPRSAERVITAVLGRNDLTDQQRISINELSMNYRSEYHDISSEMVQQELDRPLGGGRGFRGGDFQGMQQRQRDNEKLRFTRNDLSDKITGRIRTLLTDEQQEALAGVFKPRAEHTPTLRFSH